jgi:hypothetical protein
MYTILFFSFFSSGNRKVILFISVAEISKIIRFPAEYTRVREDPPDGTGQKRNGISSL